MAESINISKHTVVTYYYVRHCKTSKIQIYWTPSKIPFKESRPVCHQPSLPIAPTAQTDLCRLCVDGHGHGAEGQMKSTEVHLAEAQEASHWVLYVLWVPAQVIKRTGTLRHKIIKSGASFCLSQPPHAVCLTASKMPQVSLRTSTWM